MRKLLKSRRGMSLIEVLIASLIAIIVLGSAGIVMFQSVHTQRDAELLSNANNLAREKIESLKALGYQSIPVGEVKEESDDGNFILLTTVVAEVDPVSGFPLRMKTITVDVYTISEEVYGSSQDEGLVTSHETVIHMRGL